MPRNPPHYPRGNDVWPLIRWLAAIGGVLCLGLAASQAPQLWWPRVDATARDCVTTEGRGPHGRIQSRHRCELVWSYAGRGYHRSFELPIQDGDRVPLLVRGSDAVRPDALWLGLAGFGALGLVLLAVPVAVALYGRRRAGTPRPRTPVRPAGRPRDRRAPTGRVPNRRPRRPAP